MKGFSYQRMTTAAFLAVFFLPFALFAQAEPLDPHDVRDLETFFDAYMTTRMNADHVAGAAVSVVGDGRVIFSKGYGYADTENGIAVDPEKTRFILGSLSKLFTWTAVMQLVEQGDLDLREDVNAYLDFSVPATFSEPITLDHLMAHTAGFEDVKYGQMAASPNGLVPLGEWLSAHVPSRILPPGRYSAYQNYGAALAGYIVSRVSGMSYEEYIERRILQPLGMERTFLRHSVPRHLVDDLSKCYDFSDGTFRSQPTLADVVLNVAPAGSIVSTAEDIAVFMIAHLDAYPHGELLAAADGAGGMNDRGEHIVLGAHDKPNILQPSTLRFMHEGSFRHDPRVNGMAHGFWEMDMSGTRIIGHAGSHFIANSILLLFPDRDLGVFVVTNSRGGASFIGEGYSVFRKEFTDRFFPIPEPTTGRSIQRSRPSDRFAGRYRLTYGRAETVPEKLYSMLMSIRISKDADALLVSLPGGSTRFLESEPLVFLEEDTGDPLVFLEDAGGTIVGACYGAVPFSGLVRSKWYETPEFNLALLGACGVLFLSFPLAALRAFLFGRSRSVEVELGAGAWVSVRIAYGAAAILGLMNLAVLALVFASLSDIYHLYIGQPIYWGFIRVGALTAATGNAVLLVFAAVLWKRRFLSLPVLIHFSLFAACAGGYIWFLWFWRILAGWV